MLAKAYKCLWISGNKDWNFCGCKRSVPKLVYTCSVYLHTSLKWMGGREGGREGGGR